ncbi:MAG TPA: UDP binding domain-containing protein, partial [Bacteroidales bacterium]|nr:UDP binding domain-containing protein [Bacteroidales bacterium]
NVIKAVEKANEFQKNVIYNKILDYFDNRVENRLIGIWGLSFKPKTDDIREASSIYLINKLLSKGARVKAYDPAAMEETKKVLGDRIEYATDPYEVVMGVDALALMTEWAEFHLPDFSRLAELMNNKVIFDGRNIYDPVELKNLGFKYYGIGRR